MNRLTHGPGCEKAPTIWACRTTGFPFKNINTDIQGNFSLTQKNLNVDFLTSRKLKLLLDWKNYWEGAATLDESPLLKSISTIFVYEAIMTRLFRFFQEIIFTTSKFLILNYK